MVNVPRYHCSPRKILSLGHFIEQLSSLFKLPHFCIAKYHCVPRTQIPFTHFIEQFLGIPNTPHISHTDIHIRETITNENPRHEPRRFGVSMDFLALLKSPMLAGNKVVRGSSILKQAIVPILLSGFARTECLWLLSNCCFHIRGLMRL
jgi:hypothetical protein